ncbi:hypothetical protein Q3G72_031400 [Acer saccharum]|nr:hypothetical protein Q3G72_031400 [Acer saccharum]
MLGSEVRDSTSAVEASISNKPSWKEDKLEQLLWPCNGNGKSTTRVVDVHIVGYDCKICIENSGDWMNPFLLLFYQKIWIRKDSILLDMAENMHRKFWGLDESISSL